MARTRLLKPEFFRSEDIAALSPLARLFFQGLWGLADRDGRLLDRPRRLALEILPYDNVDGEALLTEIAKNPGLIVRYVTPDGKICIQITNFAKHQAPHFREPSLGLPGPIQDDVGQSQGLSGLAQESPVKPSPSGSGFSSGDGSGEALFAGDPTEQGQEQGWTATQWHERFCRAYEAAGKGLFTNGGPGAHRQISNLEALLNNLGFAERKASEAHAERIFAEYFADTSRRALDDRHSFGFFVVRFDQLRRPRAADPARAGPARGQPSTATREAAARVLARLEKAQPT